MEPVCYAKVTYLSWEEMERLFYEQLYKASKEGIITRRAIHEATWNIIWSIRHDNNGRSSKILDSWQDKYLEHIEGDLWQVISPD